MILVAVELADFCQSPAKTTAAFPQLSIRDIFMTYEWSFAGAMVSLSRPV